MRPGIQRSGRVITLEAKHQFIEDPSYEEPILNRLLLISLDRMLLNIERLQSSYSDEMSEY